jgi:23S rRNA pseudouridine1911/1915/1917 synthase
MSPLRLDLLVAESEEGERADRGLVLALERIRNQSDLQEDEGAPQTSPLPHLSRSRIQSLIEAGKVQLDQKPIRSNFKLTAGLQISVELPDPEPLELIPENQPIDILYEDAHLLIVNKPPGLTVHPSETQRTGTLVHRLLHHLRALSSVGGVQRPGIVHRIDKDTSGALVITKDDRTHQGLSALFAKHDIDRTYHALTYGTPKESQLTIKSLIGRSPKDRKRMSMTVTEGREAITHIKKISEFGVADARGRTQLFAGAIEATLETGRTHQIRVHLTGLGHSILGDPLYGTPTERTPKWLALPPPIQDRVKSLPGQALHARTLGFIHPVTREKIHVVAPYPTAFELLWNELNRYA